MRKGWWKWWDKPGMDAFSDNTNQALCEARRQMVETQLRARGIKDPRVLEAFATVPRHYFVPPAMQKAAYEDHPLQIGCGQTISQPFMVALMTELLHVQPEDRVLEVGTGSGYQTAILATLAREVISMERHASLTKAAQAALDQGGYDNVAIKVGDGTLGYPEAAPYDAILVTAGAPEVPEPLKRQLAVGGRLVCPIGSREMQQLVRVTRLEADRFTEEEGTKCIFVPLLGQAGWPETPE